MKKTIIALTVLAMLTPPLAVYGIEQEEAAEDTLIPIETEEEFFSMAQYFEGGRIFGESQPFLHQQSNLGLELYSHTQQFGNDWYGRSTIRLGAHFEDQNNGPLAAVTQSVMDFDHEFTASAGLTGEHLGAGTMAMKDMIETKDVIVAIGAAASAGLHGVNLGPQVEFGGSSYTITISLFDVKIGERIASEESPEKWKRQRYSINPIILVANFLLGQKSALDVIGIPVKQINPIGRLIAFLKSDDKPVETINAFPAEAENNPSITGRNSDASSIQRFSIGKPQ